MYNQPFATPLVKFFWGSMVLFLLWIIYPNAGYAHEPDNTINPLEAAKINQLIGTQVPLDVTFQDERGSIVRLDQFFDGEQPVVLVFAYYECPNLCNLVLKDLAGGLNELTLTIGEDFKVVTISIDPVETPELAAATKADYLKQYDRPKAAEGWTFLTGDHTNIDRLTNAVGFEYAYDAEKDQYAHAAGIIILTPQGKVSRYLLGLDYSPRDLRLGLVEASANKIGSVVDQVLLRCYQYDPKTGQYTFVAMNALRVAGFITVLIIGGGVWLMLRQEIAKSPKLKA